MQPVRHEPLCRYLRWRRRVAPALVMILAGCGLLAANLGYFRVDDWPRYWPVLVILVGLFQLADRIGLAISGRGGQLR